MPRASMHVPHTPITAPLRPARSQAVVTAFTAVGRIVEDGQDFHRVAYLSCQSSRSRGRPIG